MILFFHSFFLTPLSLLLHYFSTKSKARNWWRWRRNVHPTKRRSEFVEKRLKICIRFILFILFLSYRLLFPGSILVVCIRMGERVVQRERVHSFRKVVDWLIRLFSANVTVLKDVANEPHCFLRHLTTF